MFSFAPRRLGGAVVFAACLLIVPAVASAQTVGSGSASGAAAPSGARQDYRSQHFLVHSDLSPAEAKQLLEKLEYMLGIISTYWAKPPKGVIECYVVKDLANWPAGTIPDDYGREKIQRKEGVTVSLVLGNEGRATVYATAEGGVAQHEAVHAYCAQNFGTTGPTWYSEGMAEMGQYWKKGELAVAVHDYVVEHIRTSEPKSLNEIVNSNDRTGDSWQNYAWRWALCHLLATNPNYAANFRPLGLGILNQKPVSFEQAYGQVADHISFEYLFFLQRLCNGYRVDLCAWDLKRKFTALPPGTSRTVQVAAGKGYQPTGVLVKADDRLEVAATGSWKLDKTKPAAVTAAGDTDGEGKLVGVVFHNFQLSDEFEIGDSGAFTAPSEGQLFVRCKSDWGSVGDNFGNVTVKFSAPK